MANQTGLSCLIENEDRVLFGDDTPYCFSNNELHLQKRKLIELRLMFKDER